MIPQPNAATLVVASGARAAEARLLAEVGAVLEQRDAALLAALAAGDAPATQQLLARSLRIVVPSSALRDHVAAALLRHFGRSLAAVAVHTQWALALAVIERADQAPPGGEELFRVLVRRFAAEEPLLAEALGALHEGYGIALGTARDLVDAGFEPALAETLDDLLAEQASAEAERMRAVARVTARALAALEHEGLAPRTALLQRAAEVVNQHRDAAIPTGALWIHGFADATGVVADWLEALMRAFRARVLASVPPDPFDAGAQESEFSAPFLERIAGAAGGQEIAPSEGIPPGSLALLRAPGAVAEVRAVAQRIRALLDAGAAAESIGVVARRLDPYRAALEAQFARLAIPFSAPGAAGSPDARARRLAAAVRVLAEAELTPVDAWLSASAHPDADDGDLRVGLHVLGAARLADLARLDLDAIFAERDVLMLPVRRGSSDEEEQQDDAPQQRRSVRRVRSRVLHRDRLGAAHARAQALVGRMASWPERAPFAEHSEQLALLLERDLGWERDANDALAPVLASLAALGDDVPADFALTRAEFALLAGRAIERAPGTALGGAGAGVQVLSVMSARGRSFESLFVLGLQREVFPRTPTEDPIVSDTLRRAMRAVLRELPVKAQGRAEERHLFAELLSASPHVTLSWQHMSDEGREVARSSFVERLCLERPDLEVVTAPPALGARQDDDALRPAHEHAIRAALYGTRAALAPIRGEALREVRDVLGGVAGGLDAEALARVQLAILDEIDPDLRTRAGRERSTRLGPFFGYVGARAAPTPGASPELYVTRLEDLARCPWQMFLRRELRLEAAPDALDALPAISASVVGNVVHAVLQRVVDRAVGTRSEEHELLSAALERGAVRTPWPEPATLESIAAEEASRVAAEEGVRIPGFARAVARRALGMIEVARARDWNDPDGLPVLGAELAGDVVVRDATGLDRRIGFVVDRADLADGVLRLTDYKTGTPISTVTGEPKKREKLLAAISEGRALQGVAYLAAARALGAAQAEGRLLYLREDLDDRSRVFAAGHDDADLAAAFEATARTAFAALDAGTLFPRLVMSEKDQEPAACDWCEVAAACLRGESNQRARLRARLHEWAATEVARRDTASAADRALFGMFALGRGLATREEDAA